MGIDLNDLPEHVRRQVERKEASGKSRPVDLPARAVPQDSRMNKTERNYAEYLEKKKLAGEIADWQHEPFNLRLADRTFYKPDFVVVTNEGFIQIHEVKGRWMDDALVKIKVAAEMFPWFTFKAVFHEAGAWKCRHFKSLKKGTNYKPIGQ